MKWYDDVTQEDVEHLIGYCFKTVKERSDKERTMEFDKSRVYTALNADELKQGDKVIVADTIANLREDVWQGINIDVLKEVNGEDCLSRFVMKEGWYVLAYLVERAENCLKCKKNHKYYGGCEHLEPWCLDDDMKKTLTCSEYVPADPDEYKEWMPKAEPKTTEKLDLVSLGNGQYAERATEKKYRPFKDTDELIKVWDEKTKPYRADTKLPPIIMPLIWVQRKGAEYNTKQIITSFINKAVSVGIEGNSMKDLFNDYTFLDGSPCGVEE